MNDKELIKAMQYIKAYCRKCRSCNSCPMLVNCRQEDVYKFPIYWAIPKDNES